MHFGKKLTVLQFSTFVNENIAIMLDSGIDIVVLLQGGVYLFREENCTPTGWLDKPLAPPQPTRVSASLGKRRKLPRRGPENWFLPRDALKRGSAIACRPSVCPSVTLVDQEDIGGNLGN